MKVVLPFHFAGLGAPFHEIASSPLGRGQYDVTHHHEIQMKDGYFRLLLVRCSSIFIEPMSTVGEIKGKDDGKLS